jgi:hypothetical protein
MPQRQPRVPGGRRQYSVGADAAIERAIEKECDRYDITRALVIRNALAFTFNIDLYAYESKKPKIRRVK